MKYLSLLIALLACHQMAFSQKDSTGFSLGLIAEDVQYQRENSHTYGLYLEVPVGRKITLNYHYSMGLSSRTDFIAHAPLIGVVGIAFLSEGETNWTRWFGILCVLVPEGLSYTIKVKNKFSMIPYLNPLGAERTNWKTENAEYALSGEAGCRFRFKFYKDLFVAPHAGAKFLYETNSWGIEAGATIGINSVWR